MVSILIDIKGIIRPLRKESNLSIKNQITFYKANYKQLVSSSGTLAMLMTAKMFKTSDYSRILGRKTIEKTESLKILILNSYIF